MALLSLKLGGFLAIGTAGADLGNPWAMGRLIAPGNFRLGGMPPANPPPTGPPMFMFMFIFMFIFIFMPMFMFMAGGPPAPREPIFMRCSWRARAFCMMSDGRLFALGVGLLAVFSRPVTLEEGLMWLEFGSETVLREGTRRGKSPMGGKLGWASELELGG
jgi:hypothetical protein